MFPLDISSSDNVIIKYAVELAKNFDSQIVFFKTYHKTEFTYPVSGMASIMPSDRTLDNIEEGFRNEKLEYLNNNFPELYNIEFELIINSGSTVDFLAEANKDIKPDLLVIGTSGVSGLEEIFGTKAEKLTREAPCPVMVIPDELAAYKRIRKIGLALDVDYVENDLHLDILFGMAKNLSALLEIVNVSESIDDADIHHNKI
jgi:nucleotide-binding universal stress UspA family protein